MADPSSKRSTPEPSSAEDPDTAAARKELKQTAISDKPNLPPPTAMPAPNDDNSTPAAATTPDPSASDPQSDLIKEQVSSPKKKRAHDEVDEPKDSPLTANGNVSPIGAGENRTDRSEPEKKRPRDISSESKAATTESTIPNKTSEGSNGDSENKTGPKKQAELSGQADTKKEPTSTVATSASAFSSSGLSAFATAGSGFASAGSKPLSSFASGAPSSTSPFKSVGSSTTSVFGGGSLSSGSSPFGQVSGAAKPFGASSLGSGFGSTLGGGKLTSFGKSGEAFKSSKPAKAFGAPESDAESDEGEGDDEPEDNKDAGEEKEIDEEDKKKIKLQRVAVDDGEAGEATILSVRAKIFHLDKASKTWKERGAGNLKINVPLQCVDIDEDTGASIPGSFDASGLEEGDSKVVRLIMRQDSTHRVLLNAAVFPAMEFQEKEGLKAVTVLFTAIEGNKEAVSIQVKMNPVNAKNFLNEIGKVQRELQSA